MAHTLPPHLTDPRPEFTLRGHVEIDDTPFFLYDLRGNYLVTGASGHPLTEWPCDSLEEAIAAIAKETGLRGLY
jgi:hypothetical protein